MSQFALCVPREREAQGLEFRPVDSDQAMLQDASRELFPCREDVAVPYAKTGEEISELFDEAHNAVFNGRAFETTRLSTLLLELLRTCESVALWWGGEWQDLPTFHSREQFIKEVVKELREPVGDVYLMWRQ